MRENASTTHPGFARTHTDEDYMALFLYKMSKIGKSIEETEVEWWVSRPAVGVEQGVGV